MRYLQSQGSHTEMRQFVKASRRDGRLRADYEHGALYRCMVCKKEHKDWEDGRMFMKMNSILVFGSMKMTESSLVLYRYGFS